MTDLSIIIVSTSSLWSAKLTNHIKNDVPYTNTSCSVKIVSRLVSSFLMVWFARMIILIFPTIAI